MTCRARRIILFIFALTTIAIIACVVADGMSGALSLNNSLPYILGVAPFGVFLLSISSAWSANVAIGMAALYSMLYIFTLINVTFLSTSGIDSIALFTLPIFGILVSGALFLAIFFFK